LVNLQILIALSKLLFDQSTCNNDLLKVNYSGYEEVKSIYLQPVEIKQQQQQQQQQQQTTTTTTTTTTNLFFHTQLRVIKISQVCSYQVEICTQNS
jgi:hypothetical protein